MRLLASGLLVFVLAELSCYRPSFHDCQLQCTEQAGCPVDMVCLSGFCRAQSEPATLCPREDGGFAGADADLDRPDAAEPIDASAVADAHTVADAHEVVDARVADARLPADARPPDAAAPPDASCTCDPVAQSCCASGDACDLNGAGDPVCREVSVAGQQAADCNGSTQCARGYTCLSGTCHEFCDGDGDCVGGGALCDLRVGSTEVMACTSLCDPLSGSGCESGWACEVARSPATGRWHTDCRPVGGRLPGEACTQNAQCGRGYVCSGSPAVCAPYCNSQQDESGCPGTPTCQISDNPPTVSGVEWGACL